MVRVRATQIIGSHPSVASLNEQIDYLAGFPERPVLIFGEPGTGRRLAARALHEATHGSEGDFVVLAGAWYQAAKSLAEIDGSGGRPDLVHNMRKGTMVVHEIARIHRGAQAILCDWMEKPSRGASPNRRLIVTSSVPIETLRTLPSFEGRLFSIVSTSRLEVPALNARGDDVLLLAEYFLRRDADTLRLPELPLTPDIRQQLLRRPFLGNVAELEWFVQKSLLARRWVSESLGAPAGGAPQGENTHSHVHVVFQPGEMNFEQVQASLIYQVLRLCKGKQTQAANLLGISRGVLSRLIGKYPNPPANWCDSVVVRRRRLRGKRAGAAPKLVSEDADPGAKL